jgi:hypothetical protein
MRFNDSRYALQLPHDTGCPVSNWIAAIINVPAFEQSVHLPRFDVLHDLRLGDVG